MTDQIDILKQRIAEHEVSIGIFKSLAEQIKINMQDLVTEMKDWRKEMREQYATKDQLSGSMKLLGQRMEVVEDCVASDSTKTSDLTKELWSIAKYIIVAVLAAVLAMVLKV